MLKININHGEVNILKVTSFIDAMLVQLSICLARKIFIVLNSLGGVTYERHEPSGVV